MESTKSSTDQHWNRRAASVERDIEVNIMDVFQRELEYEYVTRYLEPAMKVLEVGCGNGFSTEVFRKHVAHVDAFDYSEEMVARARARVGERNNRFFHDNVLAIAHAAGPYDAAICIRVLINLRSLDEQRRALANLVQTVKRGGLLILAEGFTEGFQALNKLRAGVGLPAIVPAAINVYSSIDDLIRGTSADLEVVHTFHLGAYDYLTRVVYPLVVGPENAKHNTEFSEKCLALARAHNPECFQDFSRMRGFVFRRR